jgi:hypothetical protein
MQLSKEFKLLEDQGKNTKEERNQKKNSKIGVKSINCIVPRWLGSWHDESDFVATQTSTNQGDLY